MEDILFVSGQCEICSGELADNICSICSGRKLFIDKNIAVAEYSGVMKEVLHHYKFNKNRRLSGLIAELVYGKVIQYADLFDLITCVPIDRKKKWDRGFNQCELIAKAIGKRLKKEYCPVLKEKHHNAAQRKLRYRERFLNVLGRYRIHKARRITGKNILIIDDIFTTGATINECARILKASGAGKVYSLTIARANIKRVDNY